MCILSDIKGGGGERRTVLSFKMRNQLFFIIVCFAEQLASCDSPSSENTPPTSNCYAPMSNGAQRLGDDVDDVSNGGDSLHRTKTSIGSSDTSAQGSMLGMDTGLPCAGFIVAMHRKMVNIEHPHHSLNTYNGCRSY